MKVFLAGATGVIGRKLIHALRTRGHEVTAMTRRREAMGELRDAGARPVVADALRPEQVERAMKATRPDVVVHQLTALSGIQNYRDFDREFAPTNKLRTVGTDHLVSAAASAGVRLFVAQSHGSWIYERVGRSSKVETDPLDPDPPRRQRESLAAIDHLETTVTRTPGIEGTALRYGIFYGPGTSIAEDGPLVAQIRKRQVPLIGNGAGVWSFLHVDDAVGATIAAIEQNVPGVYNVADDDPAPVSEWLPHLAESIGARPPLRIPAWLGRLAAGEVGVSMFTQIRGISNRKARESLRWSLRWPTWREGFRTGLGAP